MVDSGKDWPKPPQSYAPPPFVSYARRCKDCRLTTDGLYLSVQLGDAEFRSRRVFAPAMIRSGKTCSGIGRRPFLDLKNKNKVLLRFSTISINAFSKNKKEF
jgi:hypothetical protein